MADSERNAPRQIECSNNLLNAAINSGAGKITAVVVLSILSTVSHHFLKPFGQPQITSDIVVRSLSSSNFFLISYELLTLTHPNTNQEFT